MSTPLTLRFANVKPDAKGKGSSDRFSPYGSARTASLPLSNGKPICKHFEQGKCTYGDACSFSHGEIKANVASSCTVLSARISVGNENICRHFLQGKCNYGAACSFSHGENVAVPAYVTASPSSNTGSGSEYC